MLKAKGNDRQLGLTLAQVNPLQITANLSEFDNQVREIVSNYPRTDLLVFPELHLFSDGKPDLGRKKVLDAASEPINGDRVRQLKQIAQENGIWLIPGSVCEKSEDDRLYNTMLLISPQGELIASYRKMFPWRPSEPYFPGEQFVVGEHPKGKIGLNVCYDAWFPETSRHLAWMGAEVIVNIVKTTTPDRAQELILARANAIVNQVFVASVNVAAPTGRGNSVLVGPEGEILLSAKGKSEEILHKEIDLSLIDAVRNEGTAGTNRMWSQFKEGDPTIPLPLYSGHIDPETWNPNIA